MKGKIISEEIRRRILPKLPRELRPQIEIEIARATEEVDLANSITDCNSCDLAKTCDAKVIGKGPTPANIMFIGEIPGEHEEVIGEPFVGPGGQMLNRALESLDMDRSTIYVTNLMKCRTPKNRTPLVGEIASCFNYLQKELELVKPKVVVCWGATTANTLIHPDFKITQEQGHWFERDGIRYMALFHPSYLLRLGEGTEKQNEAKWEVYRGLQKVKLYQDSGFKSEF